MVNHLLEQMDLLSIVHGRAKDCYASWIDVVRKARFFLNHLNFLRDFNLLFEENSDSLDVLDRSVLIFAEGLDLYVLTL